MMLQGEFLNKSSDDAFDILIILPRVLKCGTATLELINQVQVMRHNKLLRSLRSYNGELV